MQPGVTDHAASCRCTAPVSLLPGPTLTPITLPSLGAPAGMVHRHSASGGMRGRKVGLRLVPAHPAG